MSSDKANWTVVNVCPRCANTHRCPIDCTPATIGRTNSDKAKQAARELIAKMPHDYTQGGGTKMRGFVSEHSDSGWRHCDDCERCSLEQNFSVVLDRFALERQIELVKVIRNLLSMVERESKRVGFRCCEGYGYTDIEKHSSDCAIRVGEDALCAELEKLG